MLKTRVFERPLLPGWVYPCTIDDIQQRLAHLPVEDLEGLHAVGLVPSTRRDCATNARYLSEGNPTIHIYSHRETLTFKQPRHVRRSDIERGLWVGLTHGMKMEQVGSRWWCRWEFENLRRFTIEHVLLHEIGHHVHHLQRLRQGLTDSLSSVVKEQFAEDYALRHGRR